MAHFTIEDGYCPVSEQYPFIKKRTEQHVSKIIRQLSAMEEEMKTCKVLFKYQIGQVEKFITKLNLARICIQSNLNLLNKTK